MTVSINLRKIFQHLVMAFVVVGTFFYVPAHNLSNDQAIDMGYMAQELFFRYGVFFVFAFSLFMKPVRSAQLGLFAIFSVYAILLGINCGFDIQTRRSLLNLCTAFVFVKSISDYFETDNLKIVGLWILGVILFNSAFCVQQYFKCDPLFQASSASLGFKDSIVGLMKAKVHLGTLVAIVSPFIFNLVPLSVVLAVPLLCVANSSAAIAAFALSIGLLAYFRARKAVFFTSLILIVVASAFYVMRYDMPGGQFQERFKVWNAVYGIALTSHPFVGNGIGSFAKLNLESEQATSSELLTWSWAHNEYVQAFYEFGAIGLAIIFFYVKETFKDFWRFKKDRNLQAIFASLLSVFIISIFHFPFHIGRLAIPCLFTMGLFEARIKDLKNAF